MEKYEILGKYVSAVERLGLRPDPQSGELVYADDVTELFRGRTIIVHHKDEPVTDPYGSLAYGVGDEDNFICFDYAIFDEFVILDAAVNSETGKFLMGWDYEICDHADALQRASAMVDSALEWCYVDGGKPDFKGWNNGHKRFLKDLKSDLKRHSGGGK